MRKEDSCALKSEAIEVMNYEIREIGGQAKTDCIRELTKFLSATHYHRIHFQIFELAHTLGTGGVQLEVSCLSVCTHLPNYS